MRQGMEHTPARTGRAGRPSQHRRSGPCPRCPSASVRKGIAGMARSYRDALAQSTVMPASFCSASAYLARVRSMTSAGSDGPGAVLFQSSVSR